MTALFEPGVQFAVIPADPLGRVPYRARSMGADGSCQALAGSVLLSHVGRSSKKDPAGWRGPNEDRPADQSLIVTLAVSESTKPSLSVTSRFTL